MHNDLVAAPATPGPFICPQHGPRYETYCKLCQAPAPPGLTAADVQQVPRYFPANTGVMTRLEDNQVPSLCSSGGWVRHTDYAKLAADRQRLVEDSERLLEENLRLSLQIRTLDKLMVRSDEEHGKDKQRLTEEAAGLRGELATAREQLKIPHPARNFVNEANGIIGAQAKELTALRAAYDKLLRQLPEGMEHCTILFKECEKGHGWLTATNWVQHGCPTCELAAISAAREADQRELEEQKRYRMLLEELIARVAQLEEPRAR